MPARALAPSSPPLLCNAGRERGTCSSSLLCHPEGQGGTSSSSLLCHPERQRGTSSSSLLCHPERQRGTCCYRLPENQVPRPDKRRPRNDKPSQRRPRNDKPSQHRPRNDKGMRSAQERRQPALHVVQRHLSRLGSGEIRIHVAADHVGNLG